MPTLLITAGPTHEPLDAVRYLANRSSGRLGVAIANEASRRGWRVLLLLGPVGESVVAAVAPGVEMQRFRTCADLESLLAQRGGEGDVVIMAAAVADFRPEAGGTGKMRRTPGGLVLRLASTPDLLAGLAARRRAAQVLVGFALEERETMVEAAREKRARKGVDFVVANALETMDATTIEAALIGPGGGCEWSGEMAKTTFAGWLLDRVCAGVAAREQ